MKPSLDETMVTQITDRPFDRGALRRWGRKNGHLVSTIDNVISRLLWSGRIKMDENGFFRPLERKVW